MSFQNHHQVFEQAYTDGGNLAIEQPLIPINNTLHKHYTVDASLTLTKTMMWEMETRKAARPDKYLPTVVKPDSAEKFPSMRDGACEYFTRISEQKMWKDPSVYATVIEHVRLDHEKQVAIFIGAGEFTTPDGRRIVAGRDQPIFHVEHAVVGENENQPSNSWRIVHLMRKGEKDQGLKEIFVERAKSPFLPVYVEVYMRDDLGVSFTRLGE